MTKAVVGGVVWLMTFGRICYKTGLSVAKTVIKYRLWSTGNPLEVVLAFYQHKSLSLWKAGPGLWLPAQIIFITKVQIRNIIQMQYSIERRYNCLICICKLFQFSN